MNIQRWLFWIRYRNEGLKRFLCIKILGINFKIRISNYKGIKKYIIDSKPGAYGNTEKVNRDKVYLSIAAIYKDEPDIKEWLEYHLLAGVERFYLYDNESSDNSKELLKPYIDKGIVVYRYFPGNCMQLPAYRDAVYNYKNETEWMAIIDLDEYIVPVQEYDIKSVLRKYEQYPALGINWVMYDSNGHKVRPKNKLIIEAYTRVCKDYNLEDNHQIKSIVKPAEVKFIENPHFCFYKNKKTAADENKQPIGQYNTYLDIKMMRYVILI